MTGKALLVVSFGTSYAGTRDRTIGAIERRMAESFPDRMVCRAWTSGFLIRKVAKTEGLTIDTPEQAMQRLAESGVRDLILQPTHLSDGFENRRLREIAEACAGTFETLSLGRPLLFTGEDREAVAGIAAGRYLSEEGSDTALLLMGHGSEKHPVPVYGQLQQTFSDMGADRAFVGTVEGRPDFAEAAERLGRSGCGEVILAPLMIVAGDHALHDLAGDAPDSWKSRLRAAGYRTRVCLAGLGEYEEIQERFVQHAREAERIQARNGQR